MHYKFFLTSLLLASSFTKASELVEPTDLSLGPPQRFSWESFVASAQLNSQHVYRPALSPDPEVIAKIDYEALSQIHYKSEETLFRNDASSPYPVAFFPLGNLFRKSVKMHVLTNGIEREIQYSPNYFSMPENNPARLLSHDAGFAGFQIRESKSRADWIDQNWVAFLGASYFRAMGELHQYGISARGLAINTIASKPEEFPDFVEYFIEGAKGEGAPVIVYARLDSSSATGAFKFTLYRTKGAVMEVDAHVFMRRDVEQLGLAPLTSMYWYSETFPTAYDWRPEVHDSDGLALWNGRGERLWRPLNNPDRVMESTFSDKNPNGFGLLQRDRNREHYLDVVRYENRPSVWVEPIGDWGEGSVKLIEIPTKDEVHDNIVAMWVPKTPVVAGNRFHFKYRLHWMAEEPYRDVALARVVATRTGRGGDPTSVFVPGVKKFVIEFEGGHLPEFSEVSEQAKAQAQVWSSGGIVSGVFTDLVPDTNRWRVRFDINTGRDKSTIDLRVMLKHDDRILSETWLGQFNP
jgi:glucans biosynthesis protein